MLRNFLRIALPLIVLAVGFALYLFFVSNRPKAGRNATKPSPVLTVEAVPVGKTDFQVKVSTHGRVQPRTESTLVSKVAGEVVYLADSFQNNGFFKKEELLLKIDRQDYLFEYNIAESNLKNALLRNAAQDRINELGVKLDQALANLNRTGVFAPFDGRTRELSVGIGQYINKGTEIGKIFSTDYVEIPFSLASRQIRFLELPETFADRDSGPENFPKVEIIANIGERDYFWEGDLHRSDGMVDETTQTYTATARIADPYRSTAEGRPPLKVGQFVKGVIHGSLLKNVFVVPRAKVFKDSEVLLAKNGILVRQPVKLLWTDEEHAVVESGLSEGDLLIITPLGSVSGGVKVKILGENAPKVREGNHPTQKLE